MTKMVMDLMVEVERVRDAFQRAVFTAPDVAAALHLSTEDVTLSTLPTGTGAAGRDGLERYLRKQVHPHLPSDLTWRRDSRTVDRWRVAEEATVSFTFDRELPWLLPGAAPDGRPVQVLAVSVVTVHRSRVSAHRTLWDLVGLAGQLGLDGSALVRRR